MSIRSIRQEITLKENIMIFGAKDAYNTAMNIPHEGRKLDENLSSSSTGLVFPAVSSDLFKDNGVQHDFFADWTIKFS